MAFKTPPLHAKGFYTVASPFQVVANTLYECMAIRAFPDLVDLGVDIFNTYYNPLGLTQQNFEDDQKAGANIITLIADSQPVIYIPDSYILSYPDMSNVAYSNIILSLDLGVVPDTLDLTFLQNQLSGVASDVVGVTPTVTVHVGMSTGAVTQEQADAMEAARQATITNRTSDRAKVIELQNQLDALRLQYNALVDLMKSKNYIPS